MAVLLLLHSIARRSETATRLSDIRTLHVHRIRSWGNALSIHTPSADQASAAGLQTSPPFPIGPSP